MRNVKPVLLKSAYTLGLSRFATIREIVLPAALPEIVTGLRVGFSLTMIGTLLGEMFASQRGLGFMLMNAIGLHNVDLIMALTFGLVVFAGTAGIILLAIDRRLHHGPAETTDASRPPPRQAQKRPVFRPFPP